MEKKLVLKELRKNFQSHHFNNEDDIKINFYSEIIKPILNVVNPTYANQFNSEKRLLAGGRTDATFKNVSFEYKKYGHFGNSSGISEALYGRKSSKNDHGLYDYIISDSGVIDTDDEQIIISKLLDNIGVGFDGKNFIFARFIRSSIKTKLDCSKTTVKIQGELGIEFKYQIKDFDSGLRRLVLILKQQNKIALNKKNLLSIINPKSNFVRKCIKDIYTELDMNVNTLQGSNRVRTLFQEWDRVFGVMYGEDEQATEFNSVSPIIKEAYGFDLDFPLDSKLYLFSLQSFFNIFLKLLVHSFLSETISPSFYNKTGLTKAEIDLLFDGNDKEENKIINNFFEAHFMEWFTYSDSGFEVELVNDIHELVLNFDMSTFILKPEEVQDILQEIYMELIPTEMRHLMGEYFSPDWIVEHSLDMINYDGDIDKTLMDPTCGSGTFLTHALKRIIEKNNGILTKLDIEKITNNIVGFDINPISVVSAKANFIIIMFSAYYESNLNEFGDPISIPIYIADSILSPVVYSEESDNTLIIETVVGPFEIPKFENYKTASEFLNILSQSIHEKPNFERFWAKCTRLNIVRQSDYIIIKALFDRLYILHRGGKDSFWPIILRNSFAPIMIGNKFDYVVGNPPWIAWKSMSKSYREGTLEVWKSYGIFEKNAYDKKTTHDDFGMAVTYVSIDQYLKNGGEMVFLLPASFLKSTKGGEGFRKFSIIRRDQNIPFSIVNVDDFSDVSLFTIPTVAVKFIKGTEMRYPLTAYRMWSQMGRKSKFDSHEKWLDVLPKLQYKDVSAQPVDSSDLQSAWLTLANMDFANKVLDPKPVRYYKGRKGIEPAGAKGVYILKKPIRMSSGLLKIENDMSRQRRTDLLEIGEIESEIEEEFIFPMLGGRNIERWGVKSNEFLLVPHSIEHKYGIPEHILEKTAPNTIAWLDNFREGLLASRIQNGKFYNPETQPYYRLDNIGEYTYSNYKVLWKEQTGSMSAVTVGTYYQSVPNADRNLFSNDKIIVVDSKVLMLALDDEMEAYFVSGVLNAPSIREIIDGYAISTNRGIDVLKYIAIPKYNENAIVHFEISKISKSIHDLYKNVDITKRDVDLLEQELDRYVIQLFENN